MTSSGDFIHDGSHHIGDSRAEAGSGRDIHDDSHHGLLARDLTKEGAKKETRDLGRGRRRGGGGGQML